MIFSFLNKKFLTILIFTLGIASVQSCFFHYFQQEYCRFQIKNSSKMSLDSLGVLASDKVQFQKIFTGPIGPDSSTIPQNIDLRGKFRLTAFSQGKAYILGEVEMAQGSWFLTITQNQDSLSLSISER